MSAYDEMLARLGINAQGHQLHRGRAFDAGGREVRHDPGPPQPMPPQQASMGGSPMGAPPMTGAMPMPTGAPPMTGAMPMADQGAMARQMLMDTMTPTTRYTQTESPGNMAIMDAYATRTPTYTVPPQMESPQNMAIMDAYATRTPTYTMPPPMDMPAYQPPPRQPSAKVAGGGSNDALQRRESGAALVGNLGGYYNEMPYDWPTHRGALERTVGSWENRNAAAAAPMTGGLPPGAENAWDARYLESGERGDFGQNRQTRNNVASAADAEIQMMMDALGPQGAQQHNVVRGGSGVFGARGGGFSDPKVPTGRERIDAFRPRMRGRMGDDIGGMEKVVQRLKFLQYQERGAGLNHYERLEKIRLEAQLYGT